MGHPRSTPARLAAPPGVRDRPADTLKESLLADGNIPRHVAIIMDGNGRWAQRRGLERVRGHEAGKRAVREAIEGCVELGVEVLTLYTFSIENWKRPRAEVSKLMRILRDVLREERKTLQKNDVRLRVIGRIEDRPKYVRPALAFGLPAIVFVAGFSLMVGERTRRPILVFVLPLALFLFCVFFLWEWAPSWLDPRINRLLMLVDPTGFRRYGSARQLYTFKIDNVSAY